MQSTSTSTSLITALIAGCMRRVRVTQQTLGVPKNMYGVPRGLQQYRGVKFDGRLVYADSEDVDIPNSAIYDTFVTNFSDLIKRVSSTTPARRVPSKMECGFCIITSSDCPERAAGDAMSEGETEDF